MSHSTLLMWNKQETGLTQNSSAHLLEQNLVCHGFSWMVFSETRSDVNGLWQDIHAGLPLLSTTCKEYHMYSALNSLSFNKSSAAVLYYQLHTLSCQPNNKLPDLYIYSKYCRIKIFCMVIYLQFAILKISAVNWIFSFKSYREYGWIKTLKIFLILQ